MQSQKISLFVWGSRAPDAGVEACYQVTKQRMENLPPCPMKTVENNCALEIVRVSVIVLFNLSD